MIFQQKSKFAKVAFVTINMITSLYSQVGSTSNTAVEADVCVECLENFKKSETSQIESLNRALKPLTLQGITFKCQPEQLKAIENDLKKYFHDLGINQNLVLINHDDQNQTLNFVLNTPKDDTSTLDLYKRPEFAIHDEIVSLPTNKKDVFRKIKTVSKKEIAYALMQHGRNTEFTGDQCTSEALIDQVGIRQNTVAWVQEMNWGWPNGEGAKYSKKYWPKGKLVGNYSLAETMRDAFINQKDYAMGCFAATKLTMVNGILDYYDRIKKDPAAVRKISAQLMKTAKDDVGPLKNVEPGKMWYFEDNMIYDLNGKLTAFSDNLTEEQRAEVERPGKVLEMHEGVAGKNFVPGDWSYFLNPHEESYQKTGYEGSNSIYLGRDKFDDYYADQYDDKTKEYKNYTFTEKLDEVYQWENGVFSRERDAAKIKPLSESHLERLTGTPQNGGLILNYRVGPMTFTTKN